MTMVTTRLSDACANTSGGSLRRVAFLCLSPIGLRHFWCVDGAELTGAVRAGCAFRGRRLNRLLRGGLGLHLAFSLEPESTRRSRTS